MFKPENPTQFMRDLTRATKVSFVGPGVGWEADTEHGHRIAVDRAKEEFVIKQDSREVSRFPIAQVSSIRIQVTMHAQVVWNIRTDGIFAREDPSRTAHPREDSHLDGRRIFRR